MGGGGEPLEKTSESNKEEIEMSASKPVLECRINNPTAMRATGMSSSCFTSQLHLPILLIGR